MSVFLIANATVTDPAMLDEYMAAAGPTLGGDITLHVLTNDAETLEGEPAGSRAVVIEFPSRDALQAWYDSPEYRACIGLRHGSTKGFVIVADGFTR